MYQEKTDLCHDPPSCIVCDKKVWKFDRKLDEEVSSASNGIVDESIKLQQNKEINQMKQYTLAYTVVSQVSTHSRRSAHVPNIKWSM